MKYLGSRNSILQALSRILIKKTHKSQGLCLFGFSLSSCLVDLRRGGETEVLDLFSSRTSPSSSSIVVLVSLTLLASPEEKKFHHAIKCTLMKEVGSRRMLENVGESSFPTTEVLYMYLFPPSIQEEFERCAYSGCMPFILSEHLLQ